MSIENQGNNNSPPPEKGPIVGGDADVAEASVTAYDEVVQATAGRGDGSMSVTGINGEQISYTPLSAAEREFLKNDPELSRAFTENHQAIVAAFGSYKDINAQLKRANDNMALS